MTKSQGFRIFDLHIHIQPWQMLKPSAFEAFRRGQPRFEQLMSWAQQPDQFIKHLDNEGVERAALINYVSPDVMGFTDQVNEFVSEYCRPYPQRLIACGSIHPRHVKGNVASRLHQLFGDLQIRMLKIHPPHQLFYPNDYLRGDDNLRQIYEESAKRGIPVMVHTGTSIFPGARVKYGDPICLDDVAIDFPELKIILAHGGRPLWMSTAFFLMRRHVNMYLDISSFPPQNLLQYFPRLGEIADRVLFGSDWPGPGVPGIRANVDKFLALPLSEELKRRILYDNANRLFPIR